MTAAKPLSFGVVGGGIIGLAVARQLLSVYPDARVTVLEKEDRLAAHQTGRNSGVVHAGIYYAPGSLKATLCRRGVGLLRDYCAANGIPYETCGKLIVALDETERPRLDTLFERATANGVPNVRMIEGAAAIREIEPHAAGVAALHSPDTAIVDFARVARTIAAEIESRGASVRLGQHVQGVEQHGSQVSVRTTHETFTFDRLVVCAGLHSDTVAAMAGAGPDPRIVPFRGEYYLLRAEARHMVRGLIYPVPDPRYPFLGVHLTKRHDGEILVGPNAVLAFAREGYRKSDMKAGDLWTMLAWPGFRRMARQHWRMGARELSVSLRRSAFVELARQFVPDLTNADVVPGPAGIRAQAVARDGSLVDDFRIDQVGRVTAVRNAPSPGATSSFAIAEHIVRSVPVD